MRTEDISDNPKIASLTRLMLALEQSRSPYETLRTIRRGLAETYGMVAFIMLSTRGLAVGEFRVIEMQLGSDFPVDPDSWSDANSPVRRGGVFATLISRRRPQLVHDVDWSHDPHFSQLLANYGSIIAIPFTSNRLPMNWVILLKSRPQEFSIDEVDQSMLRSILIGSLMESQALAEDLAAANAKIDADVQQLADLQRSLLPDPLPHIAGLELGISYVPSGFAGGDWYDLFPLDEENGDLGHWCIFIGDVSGHGLAAAVVMAMTQAILHAHPLSATGPADLLSHANQHLCRTKLLGFVTAFLGIYEPATRRMVYASAGHPAPLIRRADKKVGQLDAALTYPLGIDPANHFEEATIQLQPGDSLLLYTDGITEAWSPDRQMFGLERLKQELASCDCHPVKLIARLRAAVTEHQKGQSPVDDQTLVGVVISPPTVATSADKRLPDRG